MIRVIIVEPETLLREGFRALISSSEDIIVSGEAQDADNLKKILETTPADIILMGIEAPAARAKELIHFISDHFPGTKTLLILQEKLRDEASTLTDAGASGIVLTSSGKN